MVPVPKDFFLKSEILINELYKSSVIVVLFIYCYSVCCILNCVLL